MKEIEIEKKYRVKEMPQNLESFSKMEIEQSYLNSDGAAIRLRKFDRGNDNIEYILSKKKRVAKDSLEKIEYNVKLTEEIYNELLEAREGNIITKTRYYIPLEDGLTIELDVFHNFFEGVCVAEIEFESEKQANEYITPSWLEPIESFRKLTNLYMARDAKDIKEYNEYMCK